MNSPESTLKQQNMSIEVKVPRLPESVADATLVSWHKAVGDTVERDENLADLETDRSCSRYRPPHGASSGNSV